MPQIQKKEKIPMSSVTLQPVAQISKLSLSAYGSLDSGWLGLYLMGHLPVPFIPGSSFSPSVSSYPAGPVSHLDALPW